MRVSKTFSMVCHCWAAGCILRLTFKELFKAQKHSLWNLKEKMENKSTVVKNVGMWKGDIITNSHTSDITCIFKKAGGQKTIVYLILFCDINKLLKV